MRYVQVAAQIAERIGAGDLTGGQKLPSGRELARQYGVSYNTIRKALQQLRDQRLIVVVLGRGTFVAG